MNDLISIIVSVYNSGKYLCECIKSILQQSYINFELILIDDGSTDDSKNICINLKKADKRIIFLSQEHKGVSIARNQGLKIAKGKYLFFMDSDDIIHFQLLEVLHELIEKTHSQMSICRYYSVVGDLEKQMTQQMAEKTESELFMYLDNSQALDYFIYGIIKDFLALGGKMFLRSAVQNILFDESLKNGEDVKFVYQILYNGADAVILHQDWYYYRQQEGNISKKHSIKTYQSLYACERYICDQEKEAGRIKNAINRENYIVDCISEWYIKSKDFQNRELLKYLNELADNEKRMDIYSCIDWRKKIKFFLVFHSYSLYWLVHIVLYILSTIYERLGYEFINGSKREIGKERDEK